MLIGVSCGKMLLNVTEIMYIHLPDVCCMIIAEETQYIMMLFLYCTYILYLKLLAEN